mmetsp:Transcript_21155/g.47732  ORF Transcript_21155/g.47732 Transcript_21155/m.47732 type:complete len:388 (+) Transcript_21155:1786-2949(+)
MSRGPDRCHAVAQLALGDLLRDFEHRPGGHTGGLGRVLVEVQGVSVDFPSHLLKLGHHLGCLLGLLRPCLAAEVCFGRRRLGFGLSFGLGFGRPVQLLDLPQQGRLVAPQQLGVGGEPPLEPAHGLPLHLPLHLPFFLPSGFARACPRASVLWLGLQEPLLLQLGEDCFHALGPLRLRTGGQRRHVLLLGGVSGAVVRAGWIRVLFHNWIVQEPRGLGYLLLRDFWRDISHHDRFVFISFVLSVLLFRLVLAGWFGRQGVCCFGADLVDLFGECVGSQARGLLHEPHLPGADPRAAHAPVRRGPRQDLANIIVQSLRPAKTPSELEENLVAVALRKHDGLGAVVEAAAQKAEVAATLRITDSLAIDHQAQAPRRGLQSDLVRRTNGE